MTLILFDIDGTLLTAGGAGRAAMVDAGRELFGDVFTLDGVEIAGRLDPLIYADAAALCGVDDGAAHHDRFRAVYRAHLERRLATSDVRALPGTADLVGALRRAETVSLGLLTGNYPETGRLKLTAAGLDESVFAVNAFGSDGGHRRDLPLVAIRRYAERHGRPIEPQHVVVIGDTAHDVDCAGANGCRCIGVGTGLTPTDELRGLGADLAVDDLSDTEALVAWIAEGAVV
jgi:phosphoglycolate phosphatase-like HAD superfamily hydrolase